MSLDLIITAPARLEPPDGAMQILAEALAGTGVERTAQALFSTRPGVQEAAMRLAWYVTRLPRHPTTGQTILDGAMRHGVLAAVRAHSRNGHPGGAFVEAACGGVCSLLEVSVVNGQEQWNPMTGPPLGEWLVGRSYAQVVRLPEGHTDLPAPRAFFASVCLRVGDADDLAAIVASLADGRIHG